MKNLSQQAAFIKDKLDTARRCWMHRLPLLPPNRQELTLEIEYLESIEKTVEKALACEEVTHSILHPEA